MLNRKSDSFNQRKSNAAKKRIRKLIFPFKRRGLNHIDNMPEGDPYYYLVDISVIL